MIAINQTPNAHSSVYLPIVFVVSSNATANDIQVRCSLYVQGNQVATLWASKIDDVFTFDLSGLLHAFMEQSVLTGTMQIFDLSGNSIPFYCEFAEFYNNSIGIKTQYDSTDSSIYKANSINLDQYVNNFDYYRLTGQESKFLTNAPKTLKINVTDKPQLFFITDIEDVVVNVEQTLATGANSNTIHTKTLTNGFGGFLLEVQNANAKRVDVWVEDDGEERISEIRSFSIVDKKAYRVEWLNLLGGVDAFNFTGTDNISVETQQSKIQHYKPNSVDASHHTETNYLTISTNRVQVFSEFVNQETAKWLSEIQQSKRVWLIENGIRKAIKVTSLSTPVKQGTDLVQVALSFKFMNFENY